MTDFVLGRQLASPPESIRPDPTGWDVSALPPASAVSITSNIPTAELNDAALVIEFYVEFSNDPTGAGGWQTLLGATWHGGPSGRDRTAKQITMGPYTTGAWPPMQRIRIRSVPNQAVNLAWTVSYV